MIGTIRKHKQWLWMLIITATILSFVVFFSPDAKWKGRFSSDNRKYINESPVSMYGQEITNEEYSRVHRETVLGYFMRSGGREWPSGDAQTGKQLERDTISRLLILKKVQELDIHASDESVALAAHDRLRDFPIKQFEKEYLLPQGFTIEDFESFLRHELEVQQLFNTAALSGKLFSPQEAEKIFRKDHEQSDTRVAIFWASNFLDKVTVTPADVTNYYAAHPALYRVQDRMEMSYVEFPLSNYFAVADKQIAKNTNFDRAVEEYYAKQGTNGFKGTNGAVLSEADAKKKIRENIREEFAMVEARKKASEFGNLLYDLQPSDRAENLFSEAKKSGFTVKTSPLLERYSTNEGEFSRGFREVAFKTSPTNPIIFTPIAGENGYYVMAYSNKIAGSIQLFDTVKAQATEDFKRSKALELARTAGILFYSTATNGLAQKKTWDALVAESHVEVVKPPLFAAITAANTMTNLDARIPFSTLQGISEKMKPGEISSFELTPMGAPEGGFIVYMNAKVAVDEAKLKSDFPQYLARMRAYRQDEAFKQYFRKLVEQSKLSVAPERPTTPVGS
jgi:hypothetical protein